MLRSTELRVACIVLTVVRVSESNCGSSAIDFFSSSRNLSLPTTSSTMLMARCKLSSDCSVLLTIRLICSLLSASSLLRLEASFPTSVPAVDRFCTATPSSPSRLPMACRALGATVPSMYSPGMHLAGFPRAGGVCPASFLPSAGCWTLVSLLESAARLPAAAVSSRGPAEGRSAGGGRLTN